MACFDVIADNVAEVSSVYTAAVSPEGNPAAQEITSECFTPADGYWRGLGEIPQSTLKLKDKYSQFDAMKRFGLDEIRTEDLSDCRCGEVLCGLIDPPECAMFESKCAPDSSVGPCMVSAEGACSAWYKYGRRRKRNP